MSEHLDRDGVTFTLAERAETVGSRLYLDGELFPYATSGDHDLTVIREHGLTVLLIPVVVQGPVTITPKMYGTAAREREDRVGEQYTPLFIRSDTEPVATP